MCFSIFISAVICSALSMDCLVIIFPSVRLFDALALTTGSGSRHPCRQDNTANGRFRQAWSPCMPGSCLLPQISFWPFALPQAVTSPSDRSEAFCPSCGHRRPPGPRARSCIHGLNESRDHRRILRSRCFNLALHADLGGWLLRAVCSRSHHLLMQPMPDYQEMQRDRPP
jgi:hypothetical protein